ncbi:hypothetical protein ACH5RR_010193 [Cinchona calisaya]|uniref:Protein kinase domain-containing protein n=1 Tax=Cinchona calisaya TaxID=153742 RepID=A0ABD3AGF4_9GENT
MLGLSKNSFSGEFPPALYNMTWLKLLSLSFNNFFGSLKSDFGLALPNFQRLYLAENFFSGSISASLSNASGLLQFDIPFNNFTGNVPTNYGNLNSLWWFNVLNNNLGSGAPADFSFIISLTNCSSLQLLDFAHNQFAGMLPKSITNLSTQLTHLLIDQNRIGGNIPEEITNLVNLTYLGMGSNLLEGKIPTSIGKLSKLEELVLESNQLTGELPDSIGNISRMLHIFVDDNRLQGSIPSSLGNLKYLLHLEFSLNKFTGILPRELMELPSLTDVLNVSSNLLRGPLPLDFGNWSNLVALDFSYNKFSGTIPSTLGKCLALEQLYMQGNSLEGSIPDLSGLKNIQFLDLSSNNLSGKIPTYMEDLPSLLNLNISLNNLEGEYCFILGNITTVVLGVFLFSSEKAEARVRVLPIYNRDANFNRFSSLGIKGTLGYAAPEYGMGYRVSTLGDVYSYGILLLEIFTGRRPTDEMFKDNMDLHRYVKMALPDKIMDIVDHSALLGGSGKDASAESLNEI